MPRDKLLITLIDDAQRLRRRIQELADIEGPESPCRARLLFSVDKAVRIAEALKSCLAERRAKKDKKGSM